jgi:hypothetical protein
LINQKSIKMKRIISILIILSTVNLCYANKINVRLYSNGGDAFDIKIENNLLYITDSLILKYVPEKDIYYCCKIINANPANWEVSKKEYTVSLIKKSDVIDKAFVSVKTYFDNNRLARSFIKIYYKNPGKSVKTKYTLKLNSKYSKEIVISNFKEILPDTGPIKNSSLCKFTLPNDTLEFIDNEDNTILFLDNSWDLYLNHSFTEKNSYSGKSLFASCLHDYCYVKILKKENSFDVYYYESGDGGAEFWGANYQVILLTIDVKVVLNQIIEEF